MWNAIADVPVQFRYKIVSHMTNDLQTKMWELTRDNPSFRPIDMIASLVKQEVGVISGTRPKSDDGRHRVSSMTGEAVEIPDTLVAGAAKEDSDEADTTGEEEPEEPEDEEEDEEVEVEVDMDEGEEEADEEVEQIQSSSHPHGVLKSTPSEQLFSNEALSPELDEIFLDGTEVAVFVGRNTLLGNSRFIKRM
eukprot:TRINITY_DN645_c0_g1_i18.p1 TRINITY_DN645_c0_g1~~TRINITY_DN645_c0_g1_i18.p1  ORF type:complete len:193 (+),score=91.61 TRINITY_DN645_c0_g1_i18:136-714(+)